MVWPQKSLTPALSQAIDLPALTEEIKKSILIDFHAILPQEVEVLQAEILLPLSQANMMHNNSDQLNLSAQSSLESDSHDTLHKKIDDLQIKFENSLTQISQCASSLKPTLPRCKNLLICYTNRS